MLYLLEEDRDRTAILIDIGYLCTDVMAVEGDAVIFQKTLPVGGGHIAADVAEGLSIPLESADQIKREYVYGFLRFRNPIRYPAEKGSRPKPSRRSRWRPCWNPAWTRLRT